MPVDQESEKFPGPGGLVMFDQLSIGNGGTGSPIVGFYTGTVAVDPASVAAGAVTETTVTLVGVAVGDFVMLRPNATGLTAGLVVGDSRVTAADTVKVRIINGSGGTIDEASSNWHFFWWDVT